MNITNFLRRTLGDTGYYCLFAASRTSRRKPQRFYTDIDALVTDAIDLDSKGFDTYFALATFVSDAASDDGGGRTVENVAELRSVFMDLDCEADNAKKFSSKSDATAKLRDFCRRLGLPRPMIVDSGRGIHVYWNLNKPATLAEWLPVATRLKELCKQHGFKADPTITADAARVLRVPGTHNHKDTPPNPVMLVGVDAPDTVSLDDLRETLGVSDTPVPAALKTIALPAGMASVGEILIQNSTSRFSTIAKKSLTGTGCAQIKHALLNPADLDEPQWRAALSIAAHCVDEETAIHKLSQGHPDYDAEDTTYKAGRIKGPYLCTRFDDYNPGVCPDCPLWGGIKSPIVIGKEIVKTDFTPDEEDGAEEITVLAPEPNTRSAERMKEYVIPKPPSPYVRGAHGGVYKLVQNDDGEDEDEFVYHHDLYATRRIYDIDDGDSVVIRLHLPQDGVREFTIPQWQVTSGQDLRKKLSAQGITAKHAKAWDKIGDYIVDWINELQVKTAADKAHRQFGWTDNMESFLVGDREYTPASVEYNPPTPATSKFIPAFTMKGTAAEWRDSMDIYNQDGMELYQLVMGFGFGSPLMALSAVNGFVLHLDGATGYGKTTVQMAAMSIWGDPEQLKMDDKDTPATKLNRLEVYKNTFAMFDEMTNTTPLQLSEMAYAVSGGRQRNRMSSGANQERTRGAPWACLVVSSGNMSWHSRIDTIKSDASAEKERVFEVRMRDYVSAGTKSDTDRFAKDVSERHYGVAGDIFMRHVVANLDSVRALYDQIQAKLDKAANLSAKNRFSSAGFASALTGIVLAKQLHLVNYDTTKLFQYVVRLLTDAASDHVNNEKTWDDVLNEYIAEHWNNILRIKSTQDLRAAPEPGVDELIVPEAVPYGKLVARYETDIGRIFLLPKPLKAWCAKTQLNYNALIEGLGTHYEVKRMTKSMGKGTHLKLPATTVVAVSMTLPDVNASDT